MVTLHKHHYLVTMVMMIFPFLWSIISPKRVKLSCGRLRSDRECKRSKGIAIEEDAELK